MFKNKILALERPKLYPSVAQRSIAPRYSASSMGKRRKYADESMGGTADLPVEHNEGKKLKGRDLFRAHEKCTQNLQYLVVHYCSVRVKFSNMHHG